MLEFDIASVHGRFQVFHNDHLKYLLTAFEKSEKLLIGITGFIRKSLVETPGTSHRSISANNPLTYYERCKMIETALNQHNVDKKRFTFTPFPIDEPDFLSEFIPTNIPCLTTIREKWNNEKVQLLNSYGYKVHILYENYDKKISGSEIRKMIIENRDWTANLPSSVYQYLESIDIQGRLKSFQASEELQLPIKKPAGE